MFGTIFSTIRDSGEQRQRRGIVCCVFEGEISLFSSCLIIDITTEL